jgi:hypothetical protein
LYSCARVRDPCSRRARSTRWVVGESSLAGSVRRTTAPR